MKKKTLAAVLALLVFFGSGMSIQVSAEPYQPADKSQAIQWAIDMFMIAGFRPEYGDDARDYMVRWENPIRIFISGDYTDEDKAALEKIVQQLNERVLWLPDVSMAKKVKLANVTITMAKLEELIDYESNYLAGNWGWFSYWYDDYKINRANIVIASDVTSQRERNHLILEELIGALGLANDITEFSDSIITQEWTTVQQLNSLDWYMLNMLYDSSMHPGMTKKEAKKILTGK